MAKGGAAAQALRTLAPGPKCQPASGPQAGEKSVERRVRLTFLTRDLNIGGAQRQLVELAKALDPTVFDVTVLCLYPGGEFSSELMSHGVRVISLDKRGRWDLFLFPARFAKTLRRLQPDILHSYLTVQNILSALLKPILPGTRIVWGIESAYFDRSQADWVALMMFRLEAFLSRFPRLVIFNSHAGRDYHSLSGFAPSRTAVIHNGIDTQRFAPNLQAGLKIRKAWRVGEETFLVGIVGRLDPIKDYPTFLRAAASFASIRPDTKFVCIGDGPRDYATQLRSLSEELGLESKVIWPGSLFEEMPAAYNALNICTSSSYGEGTSNAIAEAMACGVPCVVTDVGDSRLIVGDTGIIVPPRDPELLAAGWLELARLLDEKPELGTCARGRISSRLSLASLVQGTTQALLNLL